MGAFVPHEDYPAIVIDNGSSTCRTGIAGYDAPSSVFSSLVGRRKFLLGEDKCYVGNDAQDKRELLNLTYPIEHGIVVNWDDMEKVWDHAFFSELKVDPQQHPILISEPPLNPKGNREKIAQVLFETYMTPASFIALQPMLIKHAIGITRGLIVSMGDGAINIAPIVDGYVLVQAVRRLDFGGKDLTKHLQQLLYQQGYSFTTSSELEIVREIKEKLCLVAESAKGDLHHSTPLATLENSFQLPDKSCIKIDTEMLMCPEVLFKPNVFLKQSIVEMIVDSVRESNIDFRKDLFKMICLSGGTTLCQGFPERLKNELLDLPSTKNQQIRIWTSPKRQLLKWRGGSILASLSTFQTVWVSRHDYEEYGPQIFNVLFEKYKAPAIFIAYQPLLSLYGSFKYQGVVVSIGDGIIHVVPICQTQVQFNAARRSDFAGSSLTKYLQRLLYNSGYCFTSSAELEMVREIKEKMCFTAVDRSHFKKLSSAKDSMCVEMYKLPDGTNVKLDHERYLCPEILFEPDGEIHSGKSLPRLIESSVSDIDMTLRREMYSCVIISGGSSFFPKFTDRLQRELLCLTPPGVHHVKLCAYPERRHQEWIGGSLLASLSSFQKSWVSMKDYEEHGPNIICRNNFF